MNQKMTEKVMTAPIINDAQFIVLVVTGETEGKQRTIPKKQTHATLIALSGKPNLPRLNGPFGILLRVHMSRQSSGNP